MCFKVGTLKAVKRSTRVNQTVQSYLQTIYCVITEPRMHEAGDTGVGAVPSYFVTTAHRTSTVPSYTRYTSGKVKNM